MKKEIEDFRNEIKEYEDKLLKMGFHIVGTRVEQDWVRISYSLKNDKHTIKVHIVKDQNTNEKLAYIVFFVAEGKSYDEKTYEDVSLDEMISILNEIFNK